MDNRDNRDLKYQNNLLAEKTKSHFVFDNINPNMLNTQNANSKTNIFNNSNYTQKLYSNNLSLTPITPHANKLSMNNFTRNEVSEDFTGDITLIEKDFDHKKDINLFDKLEQGKLLQENQQMLNNKQDIEIKERIILNYIYDKENPGIPKFTKESALEKKCKEIMIFNDISADERIHFFYDRYPCLECRRKVYSICAKISEFCYFIVNNPIFDNFILFAIILNTFIILISDPLDDNSIQVVTDNYFLYFYTLECFLKMSAYGLVYNDDAYFKDIWNYLDFVVVLFGWVTLILEAIVGSKSVGLGALRAFRTLRPLKSVKSIEGLRNIVETLVDSMAGLSDILIVLFFFFLLFSVAGVQIFTGLLLRKCTNIETGHAIGFMSYKNSCTYNSDCYQFDDEYNKHYCDKNIYNPYENTVSYDNTVFGIILVLVIATMEGWSEFFSYISKTFQDQYKINSVIIFFYFHILLFVGGYYLINLFLAVIKTKYSEIEESNKIDKKPEEKKLLTVLKSRTGKKKKEKKEEKETEDTAVAKLRKEFTFIEKDNSKLPVDYSTLKDLFLIKTNTPEEFYDLKNKINIEAKTIISLYEKKESEIRKFYAKQEIVSDIKGIDVKSEKQTKTRKRRTIAEYKNLNKINVLNQASNFNLAYLEEAIKLTLVNFDEYIKSKKSNDADKQFADNNDSYHSDKDKKNIINDTDDSELSENNRSNSIGDFANQLLNYIHNKNKKTKDINKNDDKSLKKNANNKNQLQPAISAANSKKSFNLTAISPFINKQKIKDISESDITDSMNSINLETKINNNNAAKAIIDRYLNSGSFNEKRLLLSDNISESNNNSARSELNLNNKQSNKENIVKEKPLIILKNKVRDENYQTQNILTINKPITNFNNIEKYNQEKFNKAKENQTSKLNLEDVDRETNDKNYKKMQSYLNVLKYTNNKPTNAEIRKDIINYNDELENQNSLEISIIEEENLLIDEKHERVFANNVPNYKSDITLVDQNIINMPFAQIKKPEDNKDIKETSKKLQSFIPLLNDNIDKYIDEMTKVNNFHNDNKPNIKSRIKEDLQGVVLPKKKKIKPLNTSSKSIEKNYYKIPNIEISKELNSLEDDYKYPSHLQYFKSLKEQVKPNMKNQVIYLNYIFNLMNKDVKILKKANVKEDIEKILGKKKERKEVFEVDKKDPISIFNPDNVNLKKYSYIRYKKVSYENEVVTNLKHNLKNFEGKTYDIMPILNLNNHKKDIKTQGQTSLWSKKRSKTSTSITFGSSTLFINEKTNRKTLTSVASVDFSTLKLKQHAIKTCSNLLIEKNYKDLNLNFLNEYDMLPKNTYKSSYDQHVDPFDIGDVKIETFKIKELDNKTNMTKHIIWSVQDVLNFTNDEDKYDQWNREIGIFENFNVILWSQKPCYRDFQILRYIFFQISYNTYFELFIITVVLINAIIMAIDGNLLLPEQLSLLDFTKYIFNSIFIFEFIIKIIGMGPILYFSEAFNYIDFMIVVFSIVEMSTESSGGSGIDLSKFAVLRVFRIFRVLRLMKVLRKIKSIRKLIVGITKAMSNVTYILLILAIFIIIFLLLGMTLLNKNTDYQSFLPAFYNTFQLLTLENWNTNMYDLNKISGITIIYLIIWIFFGNFVLFNLFLSILLDSFSTEEEDFIDFPKNYPLTFKAYELKEEEDKKALIKRKKKKQKEDREDDNSDSHSSSDEESIQNNSTTQKTSFQTTLASTREIEKHEVKRLNKIFKGNDCEYSLYFLPQKSGFRIKLNLIINDKRFDNFILFVILFSTIRLIGETFVKQNGSLSYKILDIGFDVLDTLFNLIFLSECIMKILALGFIMQRGSYLRDSWNKLDFFIVCISVFDFQSLITKYSSSSGGANIGFLKVLRMLRILRPLRFISHNVQLKLIINSLFDSIQAIINVFFVVLVVFFIFSIIGINLFSALFFDCYINGSPNPDSVFSTAVTALNYTTANNPVEYVNTCYEMNGNFDKTPLFRFSNIIDSIISSYVLASMEGWPDIMNNYIVYSEIYGLYFVLSLLVSSYFFMNLFVGVMFSSFNDAITKEQKKGISDNKDAQKYLDYLSQLNSAKPEYNTFKKKTDKIQIFFTRIVTFSWFDNFIMIIILCNMITMAIDYEESPDSYENILKVFNYLFTGIFIVECILKFLANGFYGYFYVGWNKFDFFVVAASIIDLLMSNLIGSRVSFLKSFQIIRVLRVLRVTRVLRLVKQLKGLEKLLQTLKWSLQALGNVLILLLLVYFIFSVLGCYLFTIYVGDYTDKFNLYDQYYNFDNFYFGFLLVFRCATGESWNIIMLELANFDKNKVNPLVAYVFFIVSNFFTYIIMMNLFLLVTLQQYDEFYKKEENPIENFTRIVDSFKNSWNIYSNEVDEGHRIKHNQLTDFLMTFNVDFLQKTKDSVDKCKKYIMDLKLLKDQNDYVYFHDVLFKIFKKEFEIKDIKIKIVIKEEKKIEQQVLRKINEVINKIKKLKVGINNPLNTFNPLTSHLYFKISFYYLCQIIKNYKLLKVSNIIENNMQKIGY